MGPIWRCLLGFQSVILHQSVRLWGRQVTPDSLSDGLTFSFTESCVWSPGAGQGHPGGGEKEMGVVSPPSKFRIKEKQASVTQWVLSVSETQT